MRLSTQLFAASSLAVLALVACGGATDGDETGDSNLTSNKPAEDAGAAPIEAGPAVDCPDLVPPGPSFCPQGTVTTTLGPDGCFGYECVAGALDGGPAPKSCTAVGGACVGVSPSACPSPKRIGAASEFSCGGGVGVMCCLDSCPELDAPPPNYCKDGKKLVGAKTETGCQSYTCRRTVDVDVSATVVTVAPFEQIELLLDGEGVGGYTWEPASTGGLPQPKATITPNGGGVGSGATKSLLWEDLRAGNFTVKLKYWRTGTGTVSATREYTFVVAN